MQSLLTVCFGLHKIVLRPTTIPVQISSEVSLYNHKTIVRTCLLTIGSSPTFVLLGFSWICYEFISSLFEPTQSFISVSCFSDGLVQQPAKRIKEKDRKKKRSKNSPQSPGQQIIPEGPITDFTAVPGTSGIEVVTSNLKNENVENDLMILDSPNGDLQSSDLIPTPSTPAAIEERTCQSPINVCQTAQHNTTLFPVPPPNNVSESTRNTSNSAISRESMHLF